MLTDSLALQPDEMTDELASPVAMEPAERRFAKLYRDHADRVYALCLRMSGDRERATDLAQPAGKERRIPQRRPRTSRGRTPIGDVATTFCFGLCVVSS